jgi:enoyl-CoA hydratase/carnithine racemase
MASNELLIKREGSVVIATLNRPDKLNALDKNLFGDIKSLVDVLETEKTARALIFTGAGEKAFCVGADLKERQGMTPKDVLSRMDFARLLYQRIEKLHFPVIAAINGTALGGGLELAMACDFRVIVENAMVGLPEVDLAIIPGNGGTQRLPRLIGLAKALELILFAKRLNAVEAQKIGLVTSVCAPGKSLASAMMMTEQLLEKGPIAVRQAKMAIREGMERSFEHGLQFEIDCYKTTLYSKDRLEGLKAFSEKRKPEYLGE